MFKSVDFAAQECNWLTKHITDTPRALSPKYKVKQKLIRTYPVDFGSGA